MATSMQLFLSLLIYRPRYIIANEKDDFRISRSYRENFEILKRASEASLTSIMDLVHNLYR